MHHWLTRYFRDEDIIETIHHNLEIQKNGRAKRQEAEQKLMMIKENSYRIV